MLASPYWLFKDLCGLPSLREMAGWGLQSLSNQTTKISLFEERGSALATYVEKCAHLRFTKLSLFQIIRYVSSTGQGQISGKWGYGISHEVRLLVRL